MWNNTWVNPKCVQMSFTKSSKKPKEFGAVAESKSGIYILLPNIFIMKLKNTSSRILLFKRKMNKEVIKIIIYEVN